MYSRSMAQKTQSDVAVSSRVPFALCCKEEAPPFLTPHLLGFFFFIQVQNF
jgi:hypothetical protein